MHAWELVGAVVGAGLASGREIASFFARYGGWGYAGILLAVGMLLFLADVPLPANSHGRWTGRLWKALLSLLLIATGGAMLSGAGEVAALTLPIHGAYGIGLLATLLLAWLLACRTTAGLAWVSRLLLGVLAMLIGIAFTLPPMQAVSIELTSPVHALLRGLTYGGFNAALQWPIVQGMPPLARERRRAASHAGLMILMLLILGNALLLRHPALLGEPMPFLRLMSGLGKPGYYLGAVSLYLAILSTLTACLRGLHGSGLSVIGILLVSLLGFTGVVEVIYPLLGGGCFVMLVAAKLTNYSAKAFLSRKDML